MMKINKWWVLCVFLVTGVVFAAVPSWQIIPSESSITFTGTQNDSPITGSFKKFTGDIAFDPLQLSASKVRIVVDMNSIFTSYADIASTLLTSDWFNAKSFPQAIFEAQQFTKTGDNQYKADGTLTIRDKTVPVTLSFVGKELSKTKASVVGSTTLKRTAFGVGQGEWADTNAVKDDVRINFTITAKK